MFYSLLYPLAEDFKILNLFRYITFRTGGALATAFLLFFLCAPVFINWMKRLQGKGQPIRSCLHHEAKKGTPTMGGIIIILAILIAALLFCDLTNIYTILLILSTIWFGFLGFADDFIKVFRHNKEGMSEKGKLIGQIIMGLVIGITVCFNEHIVVREELRSGEESSGVVVSTGTAIAGSSDGTARLEYPGTEGKKGQDVVKSTKTTIPFVKNHEFDYKWLSPFKGKWGWYCKWGIYVLMIVLVITACSNGTNLTDGMDGLATGTSAIVGVVLGIFAWLSGNIINADYLNIMYIPGTGEIAVFMAAFVGALIGFLWYNAFPAQVFMGDTGSLAIGGIIGVCAILIRKELLLPILCGVFFVESLSVIIQRLWFKYTKRRYGTGRRVFKMTPLHHHFQKEGIPAVISSPAKALPEAKIVVRFWIIGIILAVLTIALLKIR